MHKQPKKTKQYQFDTNGEMEVQQQIMQSYQSGVVDQNDQEETEIKNSKNEDQLK